MTERKSLSGGDWLAIGTFGFGVLVASPMAYGMWTGAGGTSGTAAMAAALASSIGHWPALLGGAGIAILGARAFLTGSRATLLLGVLGIAGVAAGLSVVAGSLSDLRGGALGTMTGGRIALMTHPAVGILLGAIVAFAAAYFAWIREDPASAAKLAPARRATPAPPRGDDGVTPAESAMLFPNPREEDEITPARPIPAPAKPVKPLYPEDVRLKGEIPLGTKPLADVNALAAGIPEIAEPAVYRWTAPRANQNAAPDPTRIAAEEIEALADVAPPIPAYTPEPVAVVAEDVVEEVDVLPMPPRPTWETTGLTEDDEPVDAYGTPLSLVEKARRVVEEEELAAVAATRIPREIGAGSEIDVAGEEAELDALTEEELEEEFEEDLEEDLDEVAVVEVVEIRVETVRAEVEVPEVRQPSMLDELRATNAALRAEAGHQEEYDELEEEVVEDSELEEAAATPRIHEEEAELEAEMADEDEDLLVEAELVEEDLDEVDEAPIASEREPELVAASLEDGKVAFVTSDAVIAESRMEAAEARAELAIEDAALESAADSMPAVVVATPRAKTVVAPSLFDAVEPEPEPEVVIAPQAAVPASRAEKTPGRGLDPEKKLLVEVGCMFVERGRVAVSMLQRQYDMDFDQACRVLDDLQEMGLIGPYMGGKNRDILLTRDAWLEKVGAA